MTTTELVKALRICFRDLDDGADCPNCPLYGNENCLAEVMGGAADLIEWLIGANANLHEELERKDKIQALFKQKLPTCREGRASGVCKTFYRLRDMQTQQLLQNGLRMQRLRTRRKRKLLLQGLRTRE